ncbi:hypothetical protein [Vibrio rhizosphaerae]|uniref:Uncharacterized protein n=1 Tax=Vibrio rhizosphaerae TaxID=398736 RepID=A0ABU4J0B9_9VIBR|nr:hypothetical protein [Vibrio rhizosphaerae]MDW6094812.1 hypothetical protein [Vibrio rhizosphaerae]
MKKLIVGLLLSLTSVSVWSAEGYQSGSISNITATTNGIMIMMDKGLPGNCKGTPYGWMLIKQENTALTSMVLAAWTSGRKTGTVYTSGREGNQGYCLINQFDPAN